MLLLQLPGLDNWKSDICSSGYEYDCLYSGTCPDSYLYQQPLFSTNLSSYLSGRQAAGIAASAASDSSETWANGICGTQKDVCVAFLGISPATLDWTGEGNK